MNNKKLFYLIFMVVLQTLPLHAQNASTKEKKSHLDFDKFQEAFEKEMEKLTKNEKPKWSSAEDSIAFNETFEKEMEKFMKKANEKSYPGIKNCTTDSLFYRFTLKKKDTNDAYNYSNLIKKIADVIIKDKDKDKDCCNFLGIDTAFFIGDSLNYKYYVYRLDGNSTDIQMLFYKSYVFTEVIKDIYCECKNDSLFEQFTRFINPTLINLNNNENIYHVSLKEFNAELEEYLKKQHFIFTHHDNYICVEISRQNFEKVLRHHEKGKRIKTNKLSF